MVYVDYRGLAGKAMLGVLREYERLLQSADEPIMLVADFTNAAPDTMFHEEMKRVGVEYKSRVARNAFVGITGLLKILMRGFIAKTGQPTELCETLAAAKDFLASA
jgi:hypothetical protein